jgi:uncharacterized protein (TIGR00369 family)
LPQSRPSPPAGGAELIAQFLTVSPFVRHLGLRLERLEPDRALLALPFSEPLVTTGDIVHGGAVSSLIDTAAMAAAWSTPEVPENLRGTTVALSVQFLAAARGRDLVADAQVVRRGRSLCYCDVGVTDSDGQLVAKGLVTYKLG